MYLFKKLRKRRLLHLALKVSRAYRDGAEAFAFFDKDYSSAHGIDTVPGTLVRKVPYFDLSEFLESNLDVDMKGDGFSLKEERVLAIFLRKLQDRYNMFKTYLKSKGLTDSYLDGNEFALYTAFIKEAYARKAMTRLFYYCWYKATECYNDYENYKNIPGTNNKKELK